MEAKELRIGNWFVNFIGDYVQVNTYTFQNIGLYPMSPIELTEEILLKCGFENEHDDIDGIYYDIYYPKKKSEIYFVIEYKIECKAYYFTYEGNILSKNIKHLHQLQNLYYALTGNELEVCLA